MSRIESVWRQLLRPTRTKIIINEYFKIAKDSFQETPKRVQDLERKLMAALINKNQEEIKKKLISLVRACDDRPIHLNQFIKDIFKKITTEHQILLNEIITNVNLEQSLFDERKQRSLASSQRLMKRRSVVTNSCDIICKAANEGAYIAEFIHHHLSQGFRNIYIGVNNDSSGLTGKIVERISKYYPRVYLLYTDSDNAKHGSKGTYCRLFEEASRTSDSSYALVIDVDESWIASTPDQSISDFLSNEKRFHILSLHWINLCGGKLFAKPMETESCNASFSKEIKSIFSYNQPIIELRDHVPILENIDNRKIIHRTGDKSHLDAKQVNPIYIPRRKQKRLAKTKKTKAWILHRRIRSELEYSSRLFQRKASNSNGSIPFKENRDGYNDQINNIEAKNIAISISQSNRQPSSSIMPPLYEFKTQCNIAGLIEKAREECNESTIMEKIDQLNHREIQVYESVWRRTFQGTRFLKKLEERLEIEG